MVNENAELRAVLLRWLHAISIRDWKSVGNMLSRNEAMLYLGTDDRERWQGSDIAKVFGKHLADAPDYLFIVEEDSVTAYSDGAVGWGSAFITATFGDRQPVLVRNTVVFLLEDGVWRLVQVHNSTGRPNEETMGVSLTNTMDELLKSLGTVDQGALDALSRHGTATLVFTDIEASTSTAASVGDTAWAELIEWHDGIIAETTASHGGVLIKALGDGALLSFTSAHAAAATAIDIQRRISADDAPVPIAIRIGIHSGDVVRTEGDVLGTTVNTAARVTSAAQGAEIVTSAVVYGMLADSPEFFFGPSRQVTLKGLDRIHEVFPLTWRTDL